MFECLKNKYSHTEQKQEESDRGEKKPDISKAEKIAKQYRELKSCCEILSTVDTKCLYGFSVHQRGWRVGEYTIKNAGIDINNVYGYIKKLAIKRKMELECELEKLN